MSAIDTLERISNNENLISYPFRYCLVTENKLPYTVNNKLAKPNNLEDFVSLEDLVTCENLQDFMGLGISIQASNINAIDVDACFSIPFDINSIDDRGKQILDIFKDVAYCEFSFSGKGMRILFKTLPIENYQECYYIKNDKSHCEYYQPLNSARYVTITGKYIYNNKIENVPVRSLLTFLDTFMKRTYKLSINKEKCLKTENRTLEELLKKVRNFVFKDFYFQEIWLDEEHESDIKGQSLESNKDFYLIKFIYDNITDDKEMIRQIFESSPYFKSKDKKHLYKWNYNNYRYYNYIYSNL